MASVFMDLTFQSTPSAWRETIGFGFPCHVNLISIHSLRMEGDLSDDVDALRRCISIHSLRMEGDPPIRDKPLTISLFQSTPSAWRETLQYNFATSIPNYFNPLPPHGGRQSLTFLLDDFALFQSTPSAWRETPSSQEEHNEKAISIHSLRMEGDLIAVEELPLNIYFNPLPPHGGRRHLCAASG